MRPEQGQRFLEALGSKQIGYSSGQWMRATCPLAPFTHKSGKDTNPSFGLVVDPSSRATFNCFACHSGSAEELLQSMEMYAQQHGRSHEFDFKTARLMLEEEDLEVSPLPEYMEFGKTTTHFQEWPEHFLASFVPVSKSVEAIEYLISRRVPPEIVLKFDIRWDSNKRMVVFPYRNAYGKFAGARGRAIDVVVKSKHFDYTWNGVNNAHLVWFNEQVFQLSGPTVVVEGQFDCMRVSQLWPKTIACLSAKPSPMKLLKLGMADSVVLIPDNDEAGENSITKYTEFCTSKGIALKVVRLPAAVKDADECHPDFLREFLLPQIEQ